MSEVGRTRGVRARGRSVYPPCCPSLPDEADVEAQYHKPSQPSQPIQEPQSQKKERTDHQPIPQTLRSPAQHIPSHNQEPTPYPPYIPSTTPSHPSPPSPPDPAPPDLLADTARRGLHRHPGVIGGKQHEVRLCRRGSCSSPCNIDTDKGWVSMRM